MKCNIYNYWVAYFFKNIIILNIVYDKKYVASLINIFYNFTNLTTNLQVQLNDKTFFIFCILFILNSVYSIFYVCISLINYKC